MIVLDAVTHVDVMLDQPHKDWVLGQLDGQTVTSQPGRPPRELRSPHADT